MSRVLAVVAPTMSMTLGPDLAIAMLAMDTPSLCASAASFQAGAYFDTGPPIKLSARIERLLI